MAPYGDDITEAIPVPLSNPQNAIFYAPTDVAYDVAINGRPFFLNTSDDSPYRRVTAQYRKQQYDQTREAGEQSLTGWWFRSQSSFHLGAGITYFEPAQDESLRFQFTESKGVDVWTKGQATLLNEMDEELVSSNDCIIAGARDNSNDTDALVVADGEYLRKIYSSSGSTATTSTYTLCTGHTNEDFVSLTTDGTRYFAACTVGLHVGEIFGTTNDGTTYATGSSNVVVKYAKQRLIAGIDASLYELDANETRSGTHNTVVLPTQIYQNPNSDWKWTAIAEGPAAFYAAGYAGGNSSIYKITLDTTQSNTLGFPELSVPTVTADFPEGELVQAFDVYLGTYAVICTNKGARVGVVSADGDLSYGPLLFEGDCKAVTFKDKFAFVSTVVGADSGLARIDLSTPVISGSLVFAYAWDVYAAGETAVPTSTDFLGISDRIAFAVPGAGVWLENENTKVASGYLQTGFVRYNTIEAKIFKLLQPRFDSTNGGIALLSIDADGNQYNIGSFSQTAEIPEVNITYPSTPQEYLGFKFTFTRSTTDISKGPLFTGYQLKSLPAVPRQRLIQYPLACFDHESDKFGVEVGYEGRAFQRMSELENIENNGDTIRVQDFRTGESFIGLIEELDFINRTPTDKRFSGFGGMLICTIRTV